MSIFVLQGHIWRTGFECHELKSVVFEDVPEALEKWHSSGIKVCSCSKVIREMVLFMVVCLMCWLWVVYIYSSGSRLAQRLLFGNTNHIFKWYINDLSFPSAACTWPILRVLAAETRKKARVTRRLQKHWEWMILRRFFLWRMFIKKLQLQKLQVKKNTTKLDESYFTSKPVWDSI